MSRNIHRKQAHLFAALGDETRLGLVARLAGGQPLSISRLTEGAPVTRQSVTKHLRVLEKAGMVRCAHRGRESLFEFNPQPIVEIQDYLQRVSTNWDRALSRLKAHVED